MSDPIVLCDANVLYSVLLTDLILSLGEAGLYRPRWTNEIHKEWMRNVLKNQPQRTQNELDRRRGFMDQAIDHELIEGYEHRIDTLKLPDPDDRHVMAAAIEAGAQVILTYNTRDFPRSALSAHGISAQAPDEFFSQQMTSSPTVVLAVLEGMRLKRKRPEITREQLLEKLARLNLPKFITQLRAAKYAGE